MFHGHPMLAVAILVVLHFVADFILQNNWMALNKSKWLTVTTKWSGEVEKIELNKEGVKALLSHTGVYSLVFLIFGVKFVLLTFVFHTIVDALTSKATTALWFIELHNREEAACGEFHPFGTYPFFARVDDEKRHWFFVVIGADQMIHYLSLIWTLTLLHLV